MPDLTMNKDGPDGSKRVCQLPRALDDGLDFSSGDQKPEQPQNGLHHNDRGRNSGNRWRIAEPVEGMRDVRGQGPERHQPQEDEKYTQP